MQNLYTAEKRIKEQLKNTARIKGIYFILMKQNNIDIGKYKKSNCNAPAPFFSRGRMPFAGICVWDPALKEDDSCVQALTLRCEELN